MTPTASTRRWIWAKLPDHQERLPEEIVTAAATPKRLGSRVIAMVKPAPIFEAN
jgi:hypothetical protein